MDIKTSFYLGKLATLAEQVEAHQRQIDSLHSQGDAVIAEMAANIPADDVAEIAAMTEAAKQEGAQ